MQSHAVMNTNINVPWCYWLDAKTAFRL